MNRFRDLSLGIKINLVIILAGITLTIAIILIQVSSTNSLLDEIGQLSIEQEAIVIERRLTETQEDLQTAATIIVNTPGLIEAIQTENERAVRSLYLSALPSLRIDDFNIVNAEGVKLLDVDAEEDTKQEQEDELIAQVLLGIQRTTLSTDITDEGATLALVSIRPILDDSGTIIGGLFLSRKLTNETLTSINFGREGIELDLIYQNVSIAKNIGEEHNEALFRQDLISQTLAGDSVYNPEIIYSSAGIPYSEVYIPVQGLDDRSPIAVLAIRVNNGAVATFQNGLIASSGILLALLTIIVTIIVLIIVRLTITRRIAILKQATSTLARGEYSKKIDLNGQDEVGQLAEAFNQMANDIQQRQNELTDLNDSLEKRVAERTVALKEARDDALASQRIAAENSRLKSEFLSMMSHELRTPMNAIQGFTGIMLKRMAGVDYNEKAERYLTKIQSNSERLLGLINDFLDLSRIESGRLELAHSPMSPAEMAAKWKDNLSVLADNKKLAFELKVDSDLPEKIYGDEESISKVAINLVGNAIKFTETGSVTLSLQKRGGQMELQVSDTGIGIPPHARDYIFDEFRQVDQSSKRAHGGTGLGLSIVQKLVIAMDGTVNLQSEVGVGSTFTVLLPIHTDETLVNGVG